METYSVPQPAGGKIICLFGGKGGTGRTTLAVNLAMALGSTLKRRVALVDLDLQLGDVAMMLDLQPERTIADLVPVLDKLDAELLQGYMTPHASGLDVLAAPASVGQGEQVAPEHIDRILDVLACSYDYVIVDLPRQLHDNVIATLDRANLVYLVASNQMTALKSTRLCLAMLKDWSYGSDKVKLILNQAHNGSGVPMQDAVSAIDYPVFWKVPYDHDNVIGPSQWGKPFVQHHPQAKISRNIQSLAVALCGAPKPSRPLFARLGR